MAPVTQRYFGWQGIVAVAAIVGAFVVTLAASDVIGDGHITRPWIVLGGTAVTVVMNRIYVVICRRGEVLEGIDIAEAPIVALALLLPPAEAVLTFVVGSALLELTFKRAAVKKVFNVGIRAMSAGLLVLPVLVVGSPATPGPAQYAAVVLGAAAYTISSTLAVAAVASSLTGESIVAFALKDVGARMLVWAAAVTAGAASGYAAERRPGAVVGVAALTILVSLTAHAARRAQHENDRLRNMLDANAKMQTISGHSEQEAVLMDIADNLLLFKDVRIRDESPDEHERGVSLYDWDGRERWLVATPRPGSDPWSDDDLRIVETLGIAAQSAFDRARMQAELAREARVDALTGIANRREFDEAMDRITRAARGRFGVIVCDLDGFKDVNDQLGHEMGDELLRVAAGRLSRAVRSSDLVARLGGDEFAVLVEDLPSEQVLETLRASIEAQFAEAVALGRWRLSLLPASFGTAYARDPGCAPKDILRMADESMYRSKREHQDLRATLHVTLPEARAEHGTTSSSRPAVVQPVAILE